MEPAGNGHNHDSRGRFIPGNRAAVGRQGNGTAQRLRCAFWAAVTESDIEAAVQAVRDVLETGKSNERLAAAELLLAYTLGRPASADLSERIEAIEAALNG